MALTASTDLYLTADELIKEALAKIGGFVEDETLSQNTLTKCYRTLNVLLKHLRSKGLQMWLINESTGNTFTASQASYTFGQSGADVTVAQPLEIRAVYIRKTSDSTDTMVHPINREDYYNKSDKTDTGFPNNYLVERLRTLTKLTFYPEPDSDTATNYTYTVIYRKEIDDIDAGTDDIEIPKHWYLGVIYQLANLLAPEYGLPQGERRLIKAEAEQFLLDAMSVEVEDEIQIVPDLERT